MELAIKDKKIQQLQSIIKGNKKILKEKNESIREKSKDNKFLNSIVEEYDVYFEKNNKLKQQQHDALQKLIDYITTIMLDPTSTSEIIKQCKYERSLILDEMKKIKVY